MEYYLGNKLLNNKYAMYRDSLYPGAGFGQWGIHASRGPLNNRQIRYADVLLMYAEACLGCGDAGTAKNYIDQVRARVGLAAIPAATDAALRHERRCETDAQSHMREFISGKHEIFPIPYEERILNPDMTQNPGY